jgi:hypothetical protein
MKASGEIATISRIAKNCCNKSSSILLGQWSDVATIGVMG